MMKNNNANVARQGFIVLCDNRFMDFDIPRFDDEKGKAGILRFSKGRFPRPTIFGRGIVAHNAVGITLSVHSDLWGDASNFEIPTIDEYEKRTGKRIDISKCKHV